jgi:hypothetical protein
MICSAEFSEAKAMRRAEEQRKRTASKSNGKEQHWCAWQRKGVALM